MQRRGTPSAFVISITPFDDAGEIDWDGTRAHWQRLKDAGIGVYVGGGGSGEGHALLEHEVDGLLALASTELVGSVPTRAMGVEPRTARQMIEFGRKVQGHGLDAMQIYSLDMGHLGIPRPQEQERYFRDVLEHIDMPSVISTHFSVGYMVPVDLLCALCAEYPHVIGINCLDRPGLHLPRARARRSTRARRGARRRPDAHAVRARDGWHRLPVVGGEPGPAARELGRRGSTARATTRARPTRTPRCCACSRCSGHACRRRRCCGRSACPGGDPRLPRMLLTTEDDTTAGLAKLAEIGIPELEGLLLPRAT